MQLLKFHATWCNPCKNLSKTMENMEFPFPVVELDIDEEYETAAVFGVRSVPTLILIDGEGEVVERMSDSKATPQQILDTFIK